MKKDLITRLNEGPIMCAEGYLFAMERRGYLSAGPFVPEVVLEHPEVVTQLHREFIRAGSDVVQAFTYYGHREKLRIIGKEHLLEPMQKNALKIAKDAAAEFKDLDLMVCGDVANTNIFDPKDKNSFKECQRMYEEQVLWAKEAGVDFIVAETINWVDEMKKSSIAYVPEKANEQHYEVPPAFFENALGKHLKYSSGYWPSGIDTLDDSEFAMLELSAKRAELSDGIDILELGCGWGSLTLYMAKEFPNSSITAVSNSKDQRLFIEEKCQERNIENVKIITADMNEFSIDDK